MRVISWNMRRATKTSAAWKLLDNLKPDIILLQEVSSIPENIKKEFDIKFAKAVKKSGKPQTFGNAILVRGKIIDELPLVSEYDWVNKEIEYFAGNLLSCVVQPNGYNKINVISVYSPAWPIDIKKYSDIDVSSVMLKENPELWVTEILWSALKNANLSGAPWVVAGDLNSSPTFDLTWSSGNQEILDRMKKLGFTECLYRYNSKLVPTFRNPKGGIILHQMDHLFVTDSLHSNLKKCEVGDKLSIFEDSISDHLPIIGDFGG